MEDVAARTDVLLLLLPDFGRLAPGRRLPVFAVSKVRTWELWCSERANNIRTIEESF